MYRITSYLLENDADMLSKLIDNGLDIDATNRCGDTPLMFELRRDTPPELAIHTLLELGADVNVAHQNTGETPLIIVAKHKGHKQQLLRIAQKLSDYGANVTAEDAEGMCAIDYMSPEFRRHFINNHANAEMKKRKEKILEEVRKNGDYSDFYMDVIFRITNKNTDLASLYNFSKSELLYLAYATRSDEIVQGVVKDFDCDPNEVLPNGKTLFDTILDDDQKEAVAHHQPVGEVFEECYNMLLFLAQRGCRPSNHADDEVFYSLSHGGDTYNRTVLLRSEKKSSMDMEIDAMTREEKLALIERLLATFE